MTSPAILRALAHFRMNLQQDTVRAILTEQPKGQMMTDAPEQIIAWTNKDGSTQFAGDKLFPQGVEVRYVRADIARPINQPAFDVRLDAPGRIWAVTEPDDISAQIMGEVYAQQTPDGMVGKPVEYVRADTTYTAAELEAVARAALEAAADLAYRDAGRFDTPHRIRALDPAAIVAAHTGGNDRE